MLAFDGDEAGIRASLRGVDMQGGRSSRASGFGGSGPLVHGTDCFFFPVERSRQMPSDLMAKSHERDATSYLVAEAKRCESLEQRQEARYLFVRHIG